MHHAADVCQYRLRKFGGIFYVGIDTRIGIFHVYTSLQNGPLLAARQGGSILAFLILD